MNILLEMAYSRNNFKNKVQEYAVGAFYEFLIAEYFKKNNQTKWVDHKTTEVERLLSQMQTLQFYTTKGNFDKKKAALEVISDLESKSSHFFSVATNTYEKYFKEKPKKKFSESDKQKLTEDFIGNLKEIVSGWLNF